MLTLGIDLGTSAVKAALLDDDDRVIATASRPLSVEPSAARASASRTPRTGGRRPARRSTSCRPAMRPRSSEVGGDRPLGPDARRDPARRRRPGAAPLHPLERRPQRGGVRARSTRGWPALHAVTGNLAMPGFTAPKLMWVREHEPEVFARVARVLLPKAYLRLRLCGEQVEEMSDASGTLWLDVGRREWSDAALAATGMRREQMPRLVEGSARGRRALAPSWARRWGIGARRSLAGGARRQRGRRGRRRRGPGRRRLRLARHLGRALGHDRTASRRRPSAPSTPSATRCRAPGTRWA